MRVSGAAAAAACTQRDPFAVRDFRRSEQCNIFRRMGRCRRFNCPYLHGANLGYGTSPQQVALSPQAGRFPLLPSRSRYSDSDGSPSEKETSPEGDARPESQTAGPSPLEGVCHSFEMPSWASILTEQAAEEAESPERPTIRRTDSGKASAETPPVLSDIGNLGSFQAGEMPKATDASNETGAVTLDEPFHEEASVAA